MLTALVRLRDALQRTTLPLELPGVDECRVARVEMIDQLEDYVLPRLVQIDAPLLTVVGGSTGAGKSTLVNSLVGTRVTAPGVLRPTTRSPVLVHNPADADWFGQDRSVLSEGILVARHEIEYLAPLLFRVPPIVVEMWATKIGGAGFDLAYEVRDGRPSAEGGEGDVVYARAETTLVLYDFVTSTPRRMDDTLRAMLRAHSGEPVPFRWRRR